MTPRRDLRPVDLPGLCAGLAHGRPLVFLDDVSARPRAFLACRPAAASGATLRLFLAAGPGPFLLATPEVLASLGLPAILHGDEAALPCEFSADGLADLAARLRERRLGDLAGPDRILARTLPDQGLLQDPSAEARLLEACATGDGADAVLLLAPLLAAGGAAPSPGALRRLARAKGAGLLTARGALDARITNPRLIELAGVTEVDLAAGRFRLHSFFSRIDLRYHWAFVAGDPARTGRRAPLVRLESECLTGHVLGSRLCDCGRQLAHGLERIAAAGCGALVYLRQEGRGIGLRKKLEAYRLQQQERLDTVDANLAQGLPADARDYLVGAQVLGRLGVRRLRLLTNNPRKVAGLERYGLEVVERVPHVMPATPESSRYLDTKKKRLGHWL